MKKLLLKTALLLAALITGSGSAWAEEKTIEITYSNFTNTSYNTSESTFSQSDVTFGYVNAMKNGSNGTPSGWGKEQVIQTKSGSRIYNKGAISGLKKIRVYIVANTNSFTITSGTEAQPTTNSVTRPTTATGTESITYTQYASKKSTPNQTTTANYYDFDVSGDFFEIAPGGSLYIWKIVLTYGEADPRTAVNLTGFTASTTTLNVDGTATTTVTNDQAGWTAAYTYASSDENVATVDAEGVITAKAEGTATITAALNVNSEDESFKAGAVTSKFIEIEVTAATLYDAAFKVNGANYASDSKAAGAAITFPADPASIGGLSFVGWVKEGDAVTDANVVKAANMVSGGVTYLAVFGERIINSITETKSFGFETESDDNWTIDGPARGSEKVNSGSYAGKINTNNTYVTFNNKVKVTSFGFAFTRTSTNSNYNVYIETSTDNSTWKAVETYAMGDFSNGTFDVKSHTFDGSEELYVRFHCYNTTAVRWVDDVTITYIRESISYSNLTTTIAPVAANVGETGFATFSSTKALDFTEVSELYAYIATESGDRINFTRVKKVPAGTGLLLRSADGKAASASVPALVGDDADATTGNVLVAASEDIASLASTADGKNNYILNQVGGVVGFFQANNQQVAAGKAYIQVAAGSGVKSFSLDFDGEETAVSSVKAENGNAPVYNLAGQRVQKAQKGVFIQNGRKFVVK